MNGDGVSVVLSVFAAIAAVIIGVVVLIYLIVPIGKGIAWLIKHLFAFVFGMLGDALRLIGALLTGILFVPLILGNVLIGRWSAASHYGRSLQGECKTGGACVYRMLIGHPLRLVGMGNVVEGIEKRVPQAVAAAPGADKPSKRTGQFDGYQIVGSLPGGGSGGKLYVANPDAIKRAGFERAGQFGVGQVVIKAFSLGDGSSLPQIVRESRALEAAKKMGLVLDHEMNNERFYYVMRYVPGQSLSLVMQQLHAAAGNMGLGQQGLRSAMGYASDLLRTLDAYHRGGLWHKDVKPDNIIVDAEHAHLVDFGLLTHLSSSMTLTTHGTEYFRDPEMVRMALRGVKVHEVDGAKFDLFAAGAVLYAMIENSFPAHGALSQVTKPCPDGIRWIIRRAMTDYDKRYASAAQMLLDLETVRQAPDPFAVTPAMLPSMRIGLDDTPAQPVIDPFVGQAAAAGAAAAQAGPRAQHPGFPGAPAGFGAAGVGGAAGVAAGVAGVGRPRIRVVNWWTGQHEVEHPAGDAPTAPHAGFGFGGQTPPPWPPKPEDFGRYAQQVAAGAMGSAAEAIRKASDALKKSGVKVHVGVRTPGVPAAEQLSRARARMEERRRRAQERLHLRRSPTAEYRNGPNRGVGIAVLALVGIIAWVSTSHKSASVITIGDRSSDWASASGHINASPIHIDIPDTTEQVASAVSSAIEGQQDAIRQLDEARSQLQETLSREGKNRAVAKSTRQQLAVIDQKLAELRSQMASAQHSEQAIVVNAPDAPAAPAIPETSPADLAHWKARTPGIDPENPIEAQFQDAWSDGEGTALVVIDIPKPLSAEQEKEITEALLAVANSGVKLVGDYPHNPAVEVDSTKQLDMVARMLAARGIEPADSEKAKTNVQKWLLSEGSLDAAVWIRSAQDPLKAAGTSKKGQKIEPPKDQKVQLAFTVVAPELAKLDEERRDKVTDIVKQIAETLAGD